MNVEPLRQLPQRRFALPAASATFGKYFELFNTRRPHTSLDRQTPDTVYFKSLPLAAAA